MAAVVAVVVLQHPNAGIFWDAEAAAVGAFSGRRIGCPGGWYTSRPWPLEEARLFACGLQSGQAAEKAGLRAGLCRYTFRKQPRP